MDVSFSIHIHRRHHHLQRLSDSSSISHYATKGSKREEKSVRGDREISFAIEIWVTSKAGL